MTQTSKLMLLSETAIVQNESLGAYVLWKFGQGFQDRDGHRVPFLLTFLVLPLILHAPTLNMILSTHRGSGLHLLVGKLGERREDLIAIHGRALAFRQLTLESLVRAEQSGLIRIDAESATFLSASLFEDVPAPTLPERIRRLGPASEKVGYWFAGLTDEQVAQSLRVEF